jgi:hypothetical protein
MSTELNGTWIHRSYHNNQTDPASGSVVLATPWAPEGVFEVTTADDGSITGELTFNVGRTIKLSVTGQTHPSTPAQGGRPALLPSVELTAVVGPTEYRLRGWIIPDSNAIAGTVMAVSKDLAQAPDGTLGSWILVQAS